MQFFGDSTKVLILFHNQTAMQIFCDSVGISLLSHNYSGSSLPSFFHSRNSAVAVKITSPEELRAVSRES